MKPHLFFPRCQTGCILTHIIYLVLLWTSLDPLNFPSSAKVQGLGAQKKHQNVPLGLHSARYLNFRKAATCSHSQPLEWPQVAASGRSVEWPQVAAFPEWPQVAASGRFSRVAASGREWPPLSHNVMNSKLRKTPTRSRRQPTYPSQLEKKHLSNKTYLFKMFADYRQKA